MNTTINLFFIFLPLIIILTVAGLFSLWLNQRMSLAVGGAGIGGKLARVWLRAIITLGIILVLIFLVSITVTVLVAVL